MINSIEDGEVGRVWIEAHAVAADQGLNPENFPTIKMIRKLVDERARFHFYLQPDNVRTGYRTTEWAVLPYRVKKYHLESAVREFYIPHHEFFKNEPKL